MKKLLISLCLISILSGCGTTPATTVVKTEGVTITTVDTGMKVWHDYVVTHLTDGKVTQSEINNVATGYNIYYNAQLAVKAALEKTIANGSTDTVDIAAANTSVVNAETSLLSLINQYLNQ